MSLKRTLDLAALVKKKSYFLLGPRATGKSFLIRDRRSHWDSANSLERRCDLDRSPGLPPNVVFPFSTFWLRKFGKVACEAAESVEEAILGLPMAPTDA